MKNYLFAYHTLFLSIYRPIKVIKYSFNIKSSIKYNNIAYFDLLANRLIKKF